MKRHPNFFRTENQAPHMKGQYFNDIEIAKVLELGKADKSQ